MKNNKRKNKFATIAPIVFASTLTSLGFVALGTSLTSCGGDSKSSSHVTYSGQKTIEQASDTWTLEFTLTNELGTDQTLEVGYTKAVHMGSITKPTISGKKVSITVTRGSEATAADPATFNLSFKCYTGSSKVATTWEQEITDFTFKKPA